MKAQLVITIEDNDQTNVSGPINDKLLCYGMLEVARDAIQSHHAKVALRQSVVPAAMPPEALRRLRGQNGR